MYREIYSKKTAVINYGMGNIGSVCNALDFLNGNYVVAETTEAMSKADAFLLPGVGAFNAAMKNLTGSGMVDELNRLVIELHKPFFGICLGMQLIASDSVEHEYTKGLGWVDANVVPLVPGNGLKVPHVGWNNLVINKKLPLFERIQEQNNFFYDHCYHFQCNDSDAIAATCQYGITFVAAVQKGNIFATQFHPEKSQDSGLKLLRAFLNHVEDTKPGEMPC